jgi:acyl-CoA reductase-like NAD-dependent aldehyde dehydrogenase
MLTELKRLGKISAGAKCCVENCGETAVRSISMEKVLSTGMKATGERRAYLCKTHYKEFKKRSKKDRLIEKWRQMG